MALTPEQIAERMDAPALTRAQFDLLVALLLEQEWGAREWMLGPKGGLTFVGPNETKPQTMFTDNLSALCRDTEETKFDEVQGFLRKVMGSERKAEGEGQIVPLIRDGRWLEVANSQGILLTDYLVGDLWIVYAVDLPEATTTLSDEERKRLGVAREELRKLTIGNLRHLLTGIKRFGDGPSFLLTADGTYEASLLLLDALWEELAGSVEGDLMVGVPTRDVLLFTGSGSREGLQEGREGTNAVFASGHHAVSTTLLRRVEGMWKVY